MFAIEVAQPAPIVGAQIGVMDMNVLALSPGEQITYRAHLHPIVFAPPLAMFVAGLAAIYWQPLTAAALLAASAAAILAAYMKLATTEIVITNRRVVYKTGFLARQTLEMNKDKIESIDVSESLLGRLLQFGAVTIKGTGGGIEAIRNVAAPFELRQHVAARAAEAVASGVAERALA